VDNKNIHFLLKEYKGKYYLITINYNKRKQGIAERGKDSFAFLKRAKEKESVV